MAAVSVFVDDAIRGRLPLVCAKTGEPADLIIRMQRPVGSGLRSWAWVLVLFGPPGWLALLVVLMVAPAGEYLTVRVPHTEAAFSRERTLERFRLGAAVGGAALILYGVLGPGVLSAVWLALGGALVVAAVVAHVIVSSQAIGFSLDASRRWVTFTRVHPEFVRAVELREEGAHRS